MTDPCNNVQRIYGRVSNVILKALTVLSISFFHRLEADFNPRSLTENFVKYCMLYV